MGAGVRFDVTLTLLLEPSPCRLTWDRGVGVHVALMHSEAATVRTANRLQVRQRFPHNGASALDVFDGVRGGKESCLKL